MELRYLCMVIVFYFKMLGSRCIGTFGKRRRRKQKMKDFAHGNERARDQFAVCGILDNPYDSVLLCNNPSLSLEL